MQAMQAEGFDGALMFTLESGTTLRGTKRDKDSRFAALF